MGSAQAQLAKILEAKEVNPDCAESDGELLQELIEMAAYAKATNEASFLSLDATVLSIVKTRFGLVMKQKFAKVSLKAEEDGISVDVDYVISFVKGWYQQLRHVFGMSNLLKGYSTSPSSSSNSSGSNNSILLVD